MSGTTWVALRGAPLTVVCGNSGGATGARSIVDSSGFVGAGGAVSTVSAADRPTTVGWIVTDAAVAAGDAVVAADTPAGNHAAMRGRS